MKRLKAALITVSTPCVLFIFFMNIALSSDQFGPSDELKIAYVIKQIENSKIKFIRNGTEHSPKEAADHLRLKISSAKKMFWFFGPERKMTYDEFVEKIASKSSSSGKEYHVKLPNGKVITTKRWINNITMNLVKDPK